MTAFQGSFEALVSELDSIPVEVPAGELDNDAAAASAVPSVEVRRSARRRKTASGHWEGNVIVITAPERWSRATTTAVADRLVTRLLRTRPGAGASDADLEARASSLSDRYLGGVRPASIRWTDNQTTLWGSCTVSSRTIRISTRLRPVPGWVLDSVILHELAHLVHDDHSQRFRRLVEQLPRAAEADTFLRGYSLGLRELGARPAP